MLKSAKKESHQLESTVPEKPFGKETLQCLLLSLFVTYMIEALARHHILAPLELIFHNPFAFLYNYLIIACTFLPVLMVKRRVFGYAAATVVWTALGIINFVLSNARMTYLTFYDFVIFVNNLSITFSYFSMIQIILILILAAAVMWGLVLLFKKCSVHPVHRKQTLIVWSVLMGVLTIATIPYARFCTDYSNPVKAYNDYGFAYSLLRSTVDRGISKPEAYSAQSVETLLDEVDDFECAATQEPAILNDHPNIIFLQLESFVDPAMYLPVTCTPNPVPVFSYLKENCSTGLLYVPTIGGGTANVEFEVMTGMRLNDFGTGEFPYTTVLQENTCETIGFNLKSLGYSTHAIHNHIGTFYGRNEVYPHMGYDTFTPLEYMNNYTTNQIGWCRDQVLIGEIMDTLNSSDQRDLIFTITVEGHGGYLKKEPESPYAISSSGLEDQEGLKSDFDYFANTMNSVDTFLGDLLTELHHFNEPVVVIAYGDHLPAMNFKAEEMKSNTLLATEYVVWSNDNRLKKEDKDLYAYQLAADVMNRLNIHTGTLMCFHQSHMNDADYLEDLSLLSYDMLYGDQLQFSENSPYKKTPMKMGIKEIVLTDVELKEDTLLLYGKNFTPHSVAVLNGGDLKTEWINENTLSASLGLFDALSSGDTICVSQKATDGTVYTSTESVIYRP